jgi:hypothetical protein
LQVIFVIVSRYAEEGEVGGGFNQTMVTNAFRVKA